MLKQTVFIHSISSISALGVTEQEIWENYLSDEPLFETMKANEKQYWISKISEQNNQFIQQIITEDTKYKHIDRSVLMAILVSRKAIQQSGFDTKTVGINFGSSRGATDLFEKHYHQFLSQGSVSTFASPSTTLGNVASWVSHDLQSSGPEISHSITCSTGLHALLNGIAWLQAGMSNQFLVGATEAPLTAFTLAQLTALKVYSTQTNQQANQALHFAKTQNTMVLGEAAACLSVSLNATNALAKITGIGYATEVLTSSTSISADAICFQKAMKMAIGNNNLQDIDAIVMHAPGTIQGDNTEFAAIKTVFGKQLPLLTSNKYKVGHTFATSGLLSLEMAVLMLKNQQFISSPFYFQKQKKPLRKILVNAVGFGGNAVSVLIEI
jgi:3-oxoacyl-[acyl-carrier-protein] synthase II